MTVLSDFEKDTVKELKAELIKDFAYLFEKNKKENITVGECIYMQKYKGRGAIIEKGKVLGFTL